MRVSGKAEEYVTMLTGWRIKILNIGGYNEMNELVRDIWAW